MIKARRHLRRIAPAIFAIALISVLAPASAANAATYTSLSVQPTDPTISAATTWTFSVGGATAGSVKCLKIYFDTNAALSTTSPAVTPTGNPGGASLFTTGTWTAGPTAVGSTSAYTWTSSGGITGTSGSKTFTLSTTNPATAGTVYVNIATYTDTGCTAILNDPTSAAAAITNNTQVSVTVDPTFTFAVNTQPAATACNGVAASTVASTTNAVAFGHLAAGARGFGTQQLQVTTNAGTGYVVYLHSTSASTNVLKGSGAHVITDSGSVTVPAAGNAFFGYTTDSSTAAITSGNLKSVPINSGNDVVGNGSAGTAVNNCVEYAVGASATTTAADTYTATMVYTAVPTF